MKFELPTKCPEYEAAKKTCKGLIFRGYSQCFYHDFRLEEKRGFKLLKRESCLGCQYCTGTWDHVKEVISDWDFFASGTIDAYKKYQVVISGDEGSDIDFVPVD